MSSDAIFTEYVLAMFYRRIRAAKEVSRLK